MCENGLHIIFCACKQENNTVIYKRGKKKKKQKIEFDADTYYWTLLRFVGQEETDEKGRIMMPAFEIGNGLNYISVLNELNTRNCFDFDFIPQEADEIKIHKGSNYLHYISFYFRKDSWHFGRSSVSFGNIFNTISEGKVNFLNQETNNEHTIE
jgi:hypothetical protein